MTVVGGDLGQLDALQRALHGESAAVEQLVGRLTGALAGTAWSGPAADAFRGEWHERFAPALRALQAGLDDQARVVASRRAAIEQATS